MRQLWLKMFVNPGGFGSAIFHKLCLKNIYLNSNINVAFILKRRYCLTHRLAVTAKLCRKSRLTPYAYRLIYAHLLTDSWLWSGFIVHMHGASEGLHLLLLYRDIVTYYG